MSNVHPPLWVLDRLHEINPRCRLGFAGGSHYGVIELWRVREETILGAPFDGVIYGKPFDHTFYTPRHITSASMEDVFSGKVLLDVQRWMTDFKERQLAALRAKGEEEDAAIDDLAHDMGTELAWRAKQTGAERPIPVAKKFLTPEDRAILSGDAALAEGAEIRSSYVDALPQHGGAIK